MHVFAHADLCISVFHSWVCDEFSAGAAGPPRSFSQPLPPA